jgi:hypothetical protein
MVRLRDSRWHLWGGTTSTHSGKTLRSLGWSFGRKVPLHCALNRGLGRKFSDQAAAHEPRQRLNEEISGIVLVLLPRPISHREMAHQRDLSILEKLEARWAMSQPANVFGRFSHERSFRSYQAAMRSGIRRLDEREDDAFRRLHVQELVIGSVDQISNEESAARLYTGCAGREKSVSARRPPRFGHCAIAVQIGCGKRANPCVRGRFR